MKNRNLWIVLVLAVMAPVFLAGCFESPEPEENNNGEEMELSGELEDGWRVVEVEAFQFGFDPEKIVVRQGEDVRLKALSTDVPHGIGIEALDIDRTLDPGEEEIIEFTAETAGEFHIHCTVYCGAGHGDMHAELKVLE